MKKAATSRASDKPQQAPASDQKCDVGIVFALPQESARLVDRLGFVVTTQGAGFVAKSGVLGDKQIVAVNSGVGREAAYRATEALILAHRPRWIISAGFAGGLAASLRRGDFLFVNEVVSSQGRMLAIDWKIDEQSLTKTGAHVGRLLTADKLISTTREKRALHEQSGALAVDLETIAVADACRAAGTPLLAVRIISDAVDESLPRDIEKMISKPTRVRQVGFALGSMLRRPSTVKDLWKLNQIAGTLSERLAKMLVGVVEQLP